MHKADNHPDRGSRFVYLDVLRVVSTFLVLFNHTSDSGFTYFTQARQSVFFLAYLFCAVFCKIAVPIFFMITGALLLKKEESINQIIRYRFIKYLILLLAVSLILYIGRNIGKPFRIMDFLKKVYSSSVVTSLWFLYAYLAFLLILPFLRKIAKSMQPAEYSYMLVIMLLFSFLKIFNFMVFENDIQENSNFSVFITKNIVFYPLMGDFLANKLRESDLTRKRIAVISGIGLIAVFGSC